jgi:Aerotolerance regulator N-terminal
VSLDWVNPAALAGLATIAGPLVVHLLRRQRAPRVTFPTVQFLTPTRAAAARLRRPSDLLLLSLRTAIVTAAAIAAAQPVLVTSWRRATWEQRVARVVVIDDTESVAAAESRVRDAVAAERGGSTQISEIHTTNLADGLAQGAAMLRRADAGRGEIVVVSDFQLGSLTAADLGALPAETGLRFVAVDAPRPAATFQGWRTFHAGSAPAVEQQITLEGSRTRTRLIASTPSARAVTFLAPAQQAEDVAALQRIVTAAGAPDVPVDRGVTMVFPGAVVPAVEPLRARWMISAFAVASADERLRTIASASHGELARGPGIPWVPVARNASGQPVVLVAAANQDVVAYVSAAPSELVAAAALRSLLSAIAAPPSWRESEIVRLSASRLAEWTREPKPSPSRWTPQSRGDGRWLWGLALLLLLIEGFARRAYPAAREEQAHAA